MLVATVSILGILGMTIERLVYTKNTFRNITENVSVNGSGSGSAGSGNGSGSGMNEEQACQCHQWTCTNDFVFGVIVITNLCELHVCIVVCELLTT